MQYSYYAINVIALPVSGFIKRTLTSLQILQFVVGGATACGYLFVEYDILTNRSTSHNSPVTLMNTQEESSPLSGMSVISEISGPHINHQSQFEIRRIPCLQNSGQAFAIWLSILYLLPLTYLFVRFFSGSYIQRARLVS
jgi:hypothetical protein